MALKVLKYITRAVYLETDESGNIVGEKLSEEFNLYTKLQLGEWLDLVDQYANENSQIKINDKPEPPADAGKTRKN